MDVKNVFLNGDLFEVVYMQYPLRVSAPPDHVCGFRHAIYGLKQALRAWLRSFISHFFLLDPQRVLLIMPYFTVHHQEMVFYFYSRLMT